MVHSPDQVVLITGIVRQVYLFDRRLIFANNSSPSAQLWCDARLIDLRIDRWTTVAIRDSDAARLISHYLQTDHPIIAPFDSELFVRDLVDGSDSFCSSLLVNSVLYWACVCLSYHRDRCYQAER